MIPTVGEVFDGTVIDVVPFGSFIEHPNGARGLLHGRTVTVGATVHVVVLAVDAERQRFSLDLVDPV